VGALGKNYVVDVLVLVNVSFAGAMSQMASGGG
jgi:hypothetical protein